MLMSWSFQNHAVALGGGGGGGGGGSMHTYIYIYIYTYMCLYIYIYIYRYGLGFILAINTCLMTTGKPLPTLYFSLQALRNRAAALVLEGQAF